MYGPLVYFQTAIFEKFPVYHATKCHGGMEVTN